MATIEGWSLWVHIAAGTVAVFAGVAALVTTKEGGGDTTRPGIFLGSMGVVVATVVVLLAVDPTEFRIILTAVAIFNESFVFSGYRVLARKRRMDTAHPVDWAAAGSVILACIGLGGWGLDWVLRGNSFGIVMATFGSIGVAFGIIDIRQFRGEKLGEWVVNHLQRMVAAFIATVSAVSAVNLTPTIEVVAWLWPTTLGIPPIYYWSSTHSTD